MWVVVFFGGICSFEVVLSFPILDTNPCGCGLKYRGVSPTDSCLAGAASGRRDLTSARMVTPRFDMDPFEMIFEMTPKHGSVQPNGGGSKIGRKNGLSPGGFSFDPYLPVILGGTPQGKPIIWYEDQGLI